MNIYLLFTKTKCIGNLLPFRISCVLLLAALTSHTQGQVNYDEAKDKGPEAVVLANQKIKSDMPTVGGRVDDNSIKNILTEKLEKGGIGSGWRDDTQRFGGVAVYKFQIDPNTDLEDYFTMRQSGSLGALLTAQIDIATWLGAEAGMEVSINNPGDPFFADKMNSSIKNEIQENLYRLKQEAAKLGAKLETDVDITNVDRFKAAMDALIKKLDKDYDTEGKSNLKAGQFAALQAKSDTIQSKIKELQQNYDAYQQAYSKSLDSGAEIKYDHVIFGLSSVAWAENLSPKGILTIGLAYVWSPKLAKSAHAALVGDPNLDSENVKGAESLDSWLAKQDLTTLGAFRYYVDDVGDRWFIGCGVSPNSLDRADQVARISAIQNLYMPLYSRLVGTQVLKQTVKSGEKSSLFPAKAAQDLADQLRSFSKANTRGVNQVKSRDLAWPAKVTKSGNSDEGSVAVSVVALNAKSAAAALKADIQGALAAAASEREHNRRILEQAQILNIVESAKKETPPSRVPELVGKTQPPSAQPNASSSTSSTANGAPKAKANSDDKLSPQPGMKVTPGKVQDDF
jgi:uncharacterized protein YaaR (DUF327 family)